MSPAYALLPLILSGTVKATGFDQVVLGPLGVDLTVLCVLLLVAASAVAVLASRTYSLRPLIPALAFFAVSLVSAVNASPGEYVSLKTQQMFLITLTTLACLPAVLRTRSDQACLVRVWVIAGLVSALLVHLTPATARLGDRLAVGDATLTPAYLMAFGTISAIAGLAGPLPKKVAIPTLVVLLPSMIAVGSRGPLLAVLLGLLALLVLRLRLRIAVASIAVGLAGIWIGRSWIGEDAAERLTLYDYNRSYAFDYALDASLERLPLGAGWGSFAGEVPGFNYPHNFVIETSYELGLVGLAALLFLVAVLVGRVWKARRSELARASAGVLVVAMVAQSLSFDLSNRLFWIALGSSLIVTASARGEHSPTNRRPEPRRVDEAVAQ